MNQVVQTPDQHYYLTKVLRYEYVTSYNMVKLTKLLMHYPGKKIQIKHNIYFCLSHISIFYQPLY